MTDNVVMAAFVGFLIGDLPDEGLVWAIFKLVFAALLLVLMIRALRRQPKP
jgi:hypothetical protein